MKKAIVTGLVLALFTAGIPPAEAAEHAGKAISGEQKPAELSESCRKMLEKHQAMRQEMAQMNARLQQLTDKMNTAQGEEKVTAMAAVVNQLVAQHQAMQKKMEAMGPEMMQHMSEHMTLGMQPGMKHPMSECLMMKSPEGGGGAEGVPADHGHGHPPVK